jgi:glycosyltransferase involved in cell wall biosynthesis
VHVTIDYTPAVRQRAGIGRYTRGLVSALAEIDQESQYTLFCAGARPPRATWPANFSTHVSGIPAAWLTLAWHRLHLPLTAERVAGDCDVFHSPDFTLPPLRKARGVVTVHDLSFLRLPQCADPGLRAYLERAVPTAVAKAHRVLADSMSTRDDLIELLSVPPEKISVVPAGVESWFQRVRDSAKLAEARALYNLPEWFILSVGTLEPRKNFVRLISAYAQLRRQTGLPHALVIAGRPGWMYREIYDQVTAQGLDEHVRFPGFVADEDLPALYTLADLMVFPSLYEGFGIPPLEAMACGTPAVVGNNSSLPEAVGNAALLVDAEDIEGLADAMARVLGNTDLRAGLVEMGLSQAARFTWQEAASKLVTAYKLALA